MIVTTEIDPVKKKVLIVYLDEEPFRELSISIFTKKPSIPKKVESLEDLDEVILQLEIKGAKRYILNKLTQKSYHSAEITNFLNKNMVSEETIERVISDCTRYGYVNDKEWIESYVRRERDKKRGPQWIEGKLRQKKIPLEEIHLALEETDDGEAQRDQIFRLISTRYRARNLLDYREREKTIGALIRRGYDVNLVREVIRMYTQ
jgi:regulatory protein